jgi:hypothetical protein
VSSKKKSAIENILSVSDGSATFEERMEKSAIENILGVSDGSATFEAYMQSRASSKTKGSEEDSKSAKELENSLGSQNSEQSPSEDELRVYEDAVNTWAAGAKTYWRMWAGPFGEPMIRGIDAWAEMHLGYIRWLRDLRRQATLQELPPITRIGN